MKLARLFLVISIIAMFGNAVCFTAEAKKNEKKAKYVFLFIGDGMGMSSISVAESYLSYKAGKFGGEQLTMTTLPYFGTATSHSANSYVTDSSAAGTAIACGEKTNNGSLGVDASGKPIKSIAYELQEEGYQIGIISTVPINHATPGSFYANSKSRGDYYNISKQIAKSGFEYLAGLGFLDFYGENGDEPSIESYLEANGYTVSYGINEFTKDSEDNEKIVFCQASNKEKEPGNYVTDKVEEDASLKQMLELGMEYLDDDKPFFFMCEGGTIDWAAHANETMPTVLDILSFDEAIEYALEFYRNHPKETLIVVTADHETGGVSLGSGPEVDWPAIEAKWNQMGGKQNMTSDENDEFNKKTSIGWTTGSHTGAAVPVFAIGKGAEKFSGRMDNTDIKGKILCE